MDISFKTVVEYVKNLFPGAAPVQISTNPELDAAALLRISSKHLYLKARNGNHYWYCFVDDDNLPMARYLLKSNGVNVSKHFSQYNRPFYSTSAQPVLRVRVSTLNKNPKAKNFVDLVMKRKVLNFSDECVMKHMNSVRQNVK